MDPHDVAEHAFLRDLPQPEIEAVARAWRHRASSPPGRSHPGSSADSPVLSSGRRTASVVATSPLVAIGLFKRDVWALDREAPGAADRLRAAMGAHRGPGEETPVTQDA